MKKAVPAPTSERQEFGSTLNSVKDKCYIIS